MNIVITGASRGIGLELTRQAVAKGHRVLAVARTPKSLPAAVKFLEADLTDSKAAERIAKAAGEMGHVDVLINNAGIMTLGEGTEDFLKSFHLNSVVPFQVTKALVPLLRKSRDPKVVQITSLMGSISDNGSGGYYAYRSSKSALNMINMSLAKDNDWLTAIVVHPGWVKTDMGGPGAPIEPQESAGGVWKVIDGASKAASGRFFDFTGRELPW